MREILTLSLRVREARRKREELLIDLRNQLLEFLSKKYPNEEWHGTLYWRQERPVSLNSVNDWLKIYYVFQVKIFRFFKKRIKCTVTNIEFPLFKHRTWINVYSPTDYKIAVQIASELENEGFKTSLELHYVPEEKAR